MPVPCWPELLYERGETAEAERLLDESFKLGAEEGAVDMIIARFVVGARLAVLRGDRAAAAELLDEGADIAERLSIPRLTPMSRTSACSSGYRPDGSSVRQSSSRSANGR